MQTYVQLVIDLTSVGTLEQQQVRARVDAELAKRNDWSVAESINCYGNEGEQPSAVMPLLIFCPATDVDELEALRQHALAIDAALKSQIVPLEDALWQNPWASHAVSFTTAHWAINCESPAAHLLAFNFPTSDEAFGDGRHVSTRLILQLLDNALHQQKSAQLLDVGTGNGILAIVAAASGTDAVVATDIDASILEVAQQNAVRYGVGGRISWMESAVLPKGQYSLVCANILAPALLALAADLVASLTPDGRLLMAGFQILELDQIIEAFQPLRLKQKVHDHGWLAVELGY